MAYTSYHQVKRDFQNDQAYNHYAAALVSVVLLWLQPLRGSSGKCCYGYNHYAAALVSVVLLWLQPLCGSSGKCCVVMVTTTTRQLW